MSSETTDRIELFRAICQDIRVERERQGMAFSVIEDAKLKGADAANTPVIGYYIWRSDVEAGKPTQIEFGIYNPTGKSWHSVNLSLFFGPAHFIRDAGIAIAGRDTRWPYLSLQQKLAADAINTKFLFDYVVPAGMVPGTYYGNVVLWRYEQLWDRLFYFQNVR